jgi:phenylpropionate dioxygenase-like ring-hydroxylating dioxygenase large terminal subunit
MEQAQQVELLKRMLNHAGRNTRDLAGEMGAAPVQSYFDPALYQREMRTIFRQHPIVVGFSSQLAKPGDFITHNDTGQPILVVRHADGRLRAFLNVCRHRGAQVELAPCGARKRAFVCTYHGWTYDTEGRLVAMTEPEGFDCDKAKLGLRPLALAEKYGMVWVVPTALEDGTSADFDIDAYLGPLAADLAPWAMDDWGLQSSVPVYPAMNWKLVMDTFLETYHFRFLHRKSVQPLFLDHYGTYDRLGEHVRICSAKLTMPELRDKPESQWRLLDHALVLHIVFPNTVLAWTQDHCGVFNIFPTGIESSLMHLNVLVAPQMRASKAEEYWNVNARLLRSAVDEDFSLGATTQRAFHSGANKEIIFGRNESGLTYWHQAIDRAMARAA